MHTVYIHIFTLYPHKRQQLFVSVPEVKILLLPCFVIVFGVANSTGKLKCCGIRDADIISDRLLLILPAKPEETMPIILVMKNMMRWKCC